MFICYDSKFINFYNKSILHISAYKQYMKSLILIVIVAALIKSSSQKDLLLDPIISSNVLVSHYQCIKNQYSEIALWLGMSEKGITTPIQVITNAKNAGLNLHIGFYPCRALNA